MLEVVELLEGELGAEAGDSGTVWVEATEALKGVLSSATIADVAERRGAGGGRADVLHLEAVPL